MADSKTTQLTQLAGTPAANDLLMMVDVSDTTMAASGTNKKLPASYVARSGANGTLITGDGKVLTVPATGTAALLDAANAFAARQTMPALATANIDNLADDTAVNFTPAAAQGILMIWPRIGSGTTATRVAIIHFRAAGTPHCQILVQGAAQIESSTTPLAGTTGTDGRLTVSAASDGKLYVENRIGSLQALSYLIIG